LYLENEEDTSRGKYQDVFSSKPAILFLLDLKIPEGQASKKQFKYCPGLSGIDKNRSKGLRIKYKGSFGFTISRGQKLREMIGY